MKEESKKNDDLDKKNEKQPNADTEKISRELEETLDKVSQMPDEEQERILSMMSMEYSGPLPHPEILRQLEEVQPGISKVIIDDFEKRSEHNREMERKQIEIYKSEGKWGILTGAIVAIAGLTASVLLGWFGHGGAAGAVGGLSLASLVGNFIKKSTDRE